MRKKICLILVIFMIPFLTARAQFASGKYLLGGDLNLRTENLKGFAVKNEYAYVNLKFGKFIKENTVVGINLSYGHSYYDYQPNQIQESNLYGAGIFYRKYRALSKEFHVFGEGALNYSYAKYMNGNNVGETIKNGVSISLMPGLSYSLTNKVQIELLIPDLIGIGYYNEKTPSLLPGGQDNIKNTFSFLTNTEGSLLSAFGVGFKFVLGK